MGHRGRSQAVLWALIALHYVAHATSSFAATKDDSVMAAKNMGSRLPDVSEPIQRAFALRHADAKRMTTAYQALLSGDMTAFGVVANWVLSGKSVPSASAAATPCATFFRQLFETTAPTERDAFLRLALRGQLANPAVLERSPRMPLVAPEPVAEGVTRYLAAFQKPLRPVDANGLIGEQLTTFSTYPHPALVRMAGDLGLRSALPHLERFVSLKRRFHLLHTDYSTHPEEVDGLFLESLRAALRIAEKSPGAAAEVKAMLQRQQTQAVAEQNSKSLMGPGEPITLETYSDHEGMRPPTQEVLETVLPGPDRPRSKAEWLAIALAALGGDREQEQQLHRVLPVREKQVVRLPGSEWTVDADSAQAVLAGDQLYLLTRIFVQKRHRAVLWAMDAASGRTRFVAPLGVPSQDPRNPDELSAHALAMDADGSAVILGTLRDAAGQRSSYLFRFSGETGEVSAMVQVPRSEHADPQLVATDSHGYVLRQGTQLFRLGLDGSQRFRWTLAQDERVISSDGAVLAVAASAVRIARAANEQGKNESRFPTTALLSRPKVDSVLIPLLLPDGFGLADVHERRVFFFDWKGTPQGQAPLPEGAEAFESAQGPWARRSLLARHKLLVFPSTKDKAIEITVPLNIGRLLVTERAAFIGDESSLAEYVFGAGKPAPLPYLGNAHMASVLAVSHDWLILSAYQDGYRIGALRRSK